jgi:hypothetical protein
VPGAGDSRTSAASAISTADRSQGPKVPIRRSRRKVGPPRATSRNPKEVLGRGLRAGAPNELERADAREDDGDVSDVDSIPDVQEIAKNVAYFSSQLEVAKVRAQSHLILFDCQQRDCGRNRCLIWSC